jgi:DNA-binding transcriptional regulator/RsmH inhibitor MraZ
MNIRKQLDARKSEKYMLTKSPSKDHRALMLFTLEDYESYVSNETYVSEIYGKGIEEVSTDEKMRAEDFIAGSAEEVKIDSVYRMVISNDLCEFASLSKEVGFLAKKNRFLIMDKPVLDQYKASLDKLAAPVADRV